MANSYYKMIQGKKYDREMIETCERSQKRKSPLAIASAKKLVKKANDGGKVTATELETLKYCVIHFEWERAAKSYLKKELSKLDSRNTSNSSEEELPPAPYEQSTSLGYEEMVALNSREEMEVEEKKSSKPIPWRKVIVFSIGIILLLLLLWGIFSLLRFTIQKIKSRKSTNIESVSTPTIGTLPTIKNYESTIPKTPREAANFINTLKIPFEGKTLTLDDSTKERLDFLSEVLKKYPNFLIQINGHTDFIGEVPDNKVISEQRANLVRDYLLARGVNGSNLQAKGRGEYFEIASNYTTEGRKKNNRVDFRILPANLNKR